MAVASSTDSSIANAKAILSALASAAATAMIVRSVAQEYLPEETKHYFSSFVRKFSTLFSSQMTIIIEEFYGLLPNEVYTSAETYLATKISPKTCRLKAKKETEKSIEVIVDRDDEITEIYNDIKIRWVMVVERVERTRFLYNPRDFNATIRSEARSYELSFHKKHKNVIIDSYLPYIVEFAKAIEQRKKALRIFTLDQQNGKGLWESVPLNHPATFDTIAIEAERKSQIKKDLDLFLQRKEYYKRVGKAWKRGYLLFGPPGTGKSSLIAAMANYLKFDVYDLELTALKSNSELRKVLLATANRSILVVEDIDCTLDFKDREATAAPTGDESDSEKKPRPKTVTLSGFLNFIDGLWSSCGDERIIVFTTNYKERLDNALLRPGRMDMHIHLSYCTPQAFRILASNYLGIKDHHRLFAVIDEALSETHVTPAEVAEQLMKEDDADCALGGLVDFLKSKKDEEEEQGRKEGETGGNLKKEEADR